MKRFMLIIMLAAACASAASAQQAKGTANASSATSASAGDILRLEKGTTFHLTLNQSASVRGNQ